MRIIPIYLSILSVASAQLAIQSDNSTITILSKGEMITQYRTDSKVPYMYPMSAPGGTNLSRHWPMKTDVEGEEKDHPHHRSFWLSHGSVNGFDFWAWTGKKDARIVHQSSSDVKAWGNQAFFTVKLAWQGDQKTILEETRSYQIEEIDADTRSFDITSTLMAANGDVLFGDTKEGFCAFRVDRSLRLKGPTAKGGITDSHGRKGNACWGKKSLYVTFHGPDDQGKPAVITMMDHPKNLRHETWWHARDYGLLAANPFGVHDFEGNKDKTVGNYILKDQETVTFRYRLVLHRGALDEKKIESWWKAFAQ